jgi:hypothetical protein
MFSFIGVAEVVGPVNESSVMRWISIGPASSPSSAQSSPTSLPEILLRDSSLWSGSAVDSSMTSALASWALLQHFAGRRSGGWLERSAWGGCCFAVEWVGLAMVGL